MTLDDAIRENIIALAREKHIVLTKLCKISGITPSTIFDFLAGKSTSPKISTIKKLCDGAGISLKTFFASPIFLEVE